MPFSKTVLPVLSRSVFICVNLRCNPSKSHAHAYDFPMKRLNPNHYYPQMSQMTTDSNPERLRPAAGRGERLAFFYLRKSASSADKNSESGRTEIPIQLHREHRGPQRSRRPACSLADSTRRRASRFKNKIVRSHKSTQSLAGLPDLRGPLCPLCNFNFLTEGNEENQGEQKNSLSAPFVSFC